MKEDDEAKKAEDYFNVNERENLASSVVKHVSELEQELVHLRAQCAAMKDALKRQEINADAYAKRYCWFRVHQQYREGAVSILDWLGRAPEKFDAAIDAAMRKEGA